MGSSRAAPPPPSSLRAPLRPGPSCTVHPASHNPPDPSLGYHAGGPDGRSRGALRAPSAPPPPKEVCWVSGCLLLSAAAGLSRVLGRRSAPGSGSNCGPGVRQPSSRGRGPDRGALRRRPGTRGAEECPLPAEAELYENHTVGPTRDPGRRRRASLSAAETCAGAQSMRSVAAAATACVRATALLPRACCPVAVEWL